MAVPNPYGPPAPTKPKAPTIPGATVGAVVGIPKTGIPNPAGPSYSVKAASPAPTTVPAPGSVESAQAWINNPASGMGGIDAYTQKQNDRFQTASAANDTDTLGKLQADSQRAGYTLNPYSPVPNPTPTTPTAPNTTAPTAYTDWQAKQNELMAKYESLMSGSFEYNPETDPQYQAFKTLSASRADAAAKTATRSTEEELNDRGILNSSVTASQLGQIQQTAKQTAETEALAQLPQYEAQARQGYQDKLKNAADLLSFSAGRGDAAYQQEYNKERDTKNDANADRTYDRGVLEGDRTYNAQEDQRDIENTRADAASKLNEKQINAQLTGYLPDGTPTSTQQQQLLQNEWAVAEQTGKITPALASLYKIPVGTPTQSAKEFAQNLAISKQNANTSAASAANSATSNTNAATNAAQSRLMDVWKATGVAPEGIPGVKPGTPIYEKPGADSPPDKQHIQSQYVAGFDSLTPAKRKEALIKEKAAIIDDLSITGYNSLYDMYIDKYGDPIE